MARRLAIERSLLAHVIFFVRPSAVELLLLFIIKVSQAKFLA